MMAWISSFERTLLIRFFSALMTLPRSGRIAWNVRSRAATAEPPAELDLEAEPVPGGSIRLDWTEPLSPQVHVRHRIPGVGHQPDRRLGAVDPGRVSCAPGARARRRGNSRRNRRT